MQKHELDRARFVAGIALPSIGWLGSALLGNISLASLFRLQPCVKHHITTSRITGRLIDRRCTGGECRTDAEPFW